MEKLCGAAVSTADGSQPSAVFGMFECQLIIQDALHVTVLSTPECRGEHNSKFMKTGTINKFKTAEV